MECQKCSKIFTRKDNLMRHIKNICKLGGPSSSRDGMDTHSSTPKEYDFSSSNVAADFHSFGQTPSKTRRFNENVEHIQQTFCQPCQKNVKSSLWASHARTNQHKEKTQISLAGDGIQIIASAFKQRIISYKIPCSEFTIDPDQFLNKNITKIKKLLQFELDKHKCIKINSELFCIYFNPTTQAHDVKSFNTRFKIVCSSSSLTSILEEMFETIATKMDEMAERDSGNFCFYNFCVFFSSGYSCLNVELLI